MKPNTPKSKKQCLLCLQYFQPISGFQKYCGSWKVEGTCAHKGYLEKERKRYVDERKGTYLERRRKYRTTSEKYKEYQREYHKTYKKT